MSYTKQDPKTIQALFDNIAPSYERGNAVLSFNLHKIWNKTLIKEVLRTTKPNNYLDLCAGTGEISLAYLTSTQKETNATLLDFSENMLACAEERAKSVPSCHTISFTQADAQELPFEDNSFEAATIAYGIRNVKDPLKCFKETLRVLKPGAPFGILELTKPKNPLIRAGHSLYLKTALPLIGKMLTSDKQAYEYLSTSIPNFIPPETLEALLKEAGFVNINVRPLTFGVATLLTARKA